VEISKLRKSALTLDVNPGDLNAFEEFSDRKIAALMMYDRLPAKPKSKTSMKCQPL
jgi:hypothetical protein